MKTRKSTRARKPAILDDFLIYLQEVKFNNQEEYLMNFKGAIESSYHQNWQEVVQSKSNSMENKPSVRVS